MANPNDFSEQLIAWQARKINEGKGPAAELLNLMQKAGWKQEEGYWVSPEKTARCWFGDLRIVVDFLSDINASWKYQGAFFYQTFLEFIKSKAAEKGEANG